MVSTISSTRTNIKLDRGHKQKTTKRLRQNRRSLLVYLKATRHNHANACVRVFFLVALKKICTKEIFRLSLRCNLDILACGRMSGRKITTPWQFGPLGLKVLGRLFFLFNSLVCVPSCRICVFGQYRQLWLMRILFACARFYCKTYFYAAIPSCHAFRNHGFLEKMRLRAWRWCPAVV